MTLVKAVVVDDRGGELLGELEAEVEGLDSALEFGGVALVEFVAGVLEEGAALLGLFHAFFGEGAVVPAGELVLVVPGGLAVTEEDELVSRGMEGCGFERCRVMRNEIEGGDKGKEEDKVEETTNTGVSGEHHALRMLVRD